jgi:hypothetical protein
MTVNVLARVSALSECGPRGMADACLGGRAAASVGARRRHDGKARRALERRAEKFLHFALNFLAMPADCAYVPLAQIRTCLWPCVDR